MTEPIAIVGSACRFPGHASSPSKLWDLIKAPSDLVGQFPPERLNLSNLYSENGEYHGRTDVQNKSYLLQEDYRHFDAPFFRINPLEAEGMDPQQRILLETVFESLESAGWPLRSLQGSSTGVYVGLMTADFHDIQMRDPDAFLTYTATGTARSILANRVSYAFDLRGPSMTIDTACSSSLVALHQAVQALRNGDAAQAIVAGAALILDPAMYVAESKLHMLSPDSRCRMWDSRANGYARGEGCGVVVLKPLSQAIRDNDHIECVVRETGVNSDGRTGGITMPSAAAQTALIQQTYKRAGLDPTKDRCQYFECHGTGTLAGDPVEARAIRDAFFPESLGISTSEPLYCGSAKTVVGHLEGCAGLAGILKASLAIQNKAIPPNLHFEQLNPAIQPYYDNLCVPTSLIPWPETHDKPLRASVNSFGFGGTNAHAILEGFEEQRQRTSAGNDIQTKCVSHTAPCGPWVFSAKTRSSLLQVLKRISGYISLNPSMDLNTLGGILQQRRDAFSFRTAIAARDTEELLGILGKHITAAEATSESQLGVRALAIDPEKPARILGVFTGQGAQHASMGRELMEHSPLFRESLEKCESWLGEIPHPPSWSLQEELAADAPASRISRAEFSQPLCTAIQIATVDVLRAAGIRFGAVVGHSSGEIGAAYAAGVLTAKDALAIAYYRGLVAHLARGKEGQNGGMAAVGMSFDDASSFCSQPRYAGRIGVAASNSPWSATLAGDIDAINEAKEDLDSGKVFARLLKVDVGYHSHHMRMCADTYRAYLEELNITPGTAGDECIWSSSVRPNTNLLELPPTDELGNQYWVENMVQPVLFSQALDFLASKHTLTAAIEVGPHPALKGPVTQTLKLSTDNSIPYAWTLERDVSELNTMSTALGLVWCHLGPGFVDLGGWRRACGYPRQPKMAKGLPSYPWDHNQTYWHEPRVSRTYRLGGEPPHELLGRLTEDGSSQMSWRNIIHLKEMPWLRGHQFQGQVIFPAAGYVSMAAQAAGRFARGRKIQVLEIQDVDIPKAFIINGDSSGNEVTFTIRDRQSNESGDSSNLLYADFVVYSCRDGVTLDKTCSGLLVIHLEDSPTAHVAAIQMSQAELPPLNAARFYKAVSGLGIDYSGVFRALTSVNRLAGHARAKASWAEGALGEEYALHPAVLDTGFQAGVATFVSIADKSMGSPYLPCKIRRLVLHASAPLQKPSAAAEIDIEAHATNFTSSVLELDMGVVGVCGGIPSVQIDGLVLKSIGEPDPASDRELFAKTIWDLDVSCGLPTLPSAQASSGELEYIDAVERTSLYFMQNLLRQISPGEIATFKLHHQQLFRAIDLFLDPVRKGSHAVLKQEWLSDDRAAIRRLAERYPNSVDLALLTSVGENWPSVVRGESEMLEHMIKDNLLSRLYAEGRGFSACNHHVAAFMRTITHKYPRARILEIGAGTGGTTRNILDAIGNSYTSYTYTDISAGFFEKASERFQDHAKKMEFKIFNAEKLPAGQGLAEGSYDVIIAANVLHATRKLSDTMRHTRSLLRPGGFLLAVEVTGTMLREPGLMGGLEGWWLGADDGRFPCPGISVKQWDSVLQKTGFSGVESIAYDMPDISRHNCSVFASQAVDAQFDLLRDPFSSAELIPNAHVLIIGGETFSVSKAVRRAEKVFKRWTSRVTTCSHIENLDVSEITPETSVLCLSELDSPVFSVGLSKEKLANLQEILGTAQNVLWVTCGRLAHSPYSNMMIGIGRALAFELPHVQLQFLDFDQETSWDMDLVAQYLARMVLLSSDVFPGHNMLWAQEPEVLVKKEMILVPRLVPNKEANESLNARRRRVTKIVDKSAKVEVLESGLVQALPMAVPTGSVEINVRFSIPLHSRGEIPCYLCLGSSGDSGSPTFAFSHSNSSSIIVEKASAYRPTEACFSRPLKLVALGAALIASYVMSIIPQSGTSLILEPPNAVADAITSMAKLTNAEVLFITSHRGCEKPGWLTIHPFASARSIHQLLPPDVKCLVSLSPHAAMDTMLRCLPKACIIQYFDPGNIPRHEMAMSNAFYMEKCETEASKVPVLSLDEFSQGAIKNERLSYILDWTRAGPLTVAVPPLDPRNMFSADKTYLLVGMTGELGQSLCYLMANGGARYIVLASRTPDSEMQWLAEMQKFGVKVRMVKMDVTDQAQIKHALSAIRSTMPEIGGVANAALVLEDSLFVNTNSEAVERQLKPKVDGTLHLDQEFATHELEFFIAFSSLGSVYGNAGQSVYHAANMFMTALIEKRRRRGQVGSVIDVGMISDVGYVARKERETPGIEEHLRAQFYTPLSETDFHQLVLQGILHGRPSSPTGVVTMGIQPFIDDPGASTKPQWYRNPYFSHMIRAQASLGRPLESSSSRQELRAKLEKVETVTAAKEAFEELFRNKLENMMKVPAPSIDVNAPLFDLGLDSLLGVEIRTWLLKDMNMDVPLLGILGRGTMASICLTAAQQLIAHKTTINTASPCDELEPESTVDTDCSKSSSPTGDNSLEFSDHPSPGGPSSESVDLSHRKHSHLNEDAQESITPSDTLDTATPSSGVSLSDFHSEVEYSRIGPMSYAQSSLHFLNSYVDDPSTFNITAQYNIQGRLNIARFKRALDKTLQRHDAYQTCFLSEPGILEPNQCIGKGRRDDGLVHLHSTLPDAVEDAFQAFVNHKWKLDTGQTLQAVLVTHTPESNTLVIGCHHIIMDGMSWHIFLDDLDQAYQLIPFKSTSVSYLDFSQQQIQNVESGRLEDSVQYWLGELQPPPSVLPLLPISRTRARTTRRVYDNNTVQRKLSVELVDAIKSASFSNRATPMHFHLAAAQTLFAYFLELDDICIGVTDAGRGSNGFSATVGHFTNLLPMRFHVNKDGSFAELVQNTAKTVLTAYNHAEVPIEYILERMCTKRSDTHTPLFQVAFNYRVGDLLERCLGNCTMALERYVDAKTPYDMTINLTQNARGGSLLEISSNDSLYSMSAAEFIADTYISFLDVLSSNPGTKLRDHRPYGAEQVQSAIRLGHGSRLEHAWPRTITERILQVRHVLPDAIAIRDGDGFSSYTQLLSRVHSISSAILAAGAQLGSHIAVLCEPSIDTYAAMLAIVHIGAVYVPLDTSLPAARHGTMIDVCKPSLLVSHDQTAVTSTGLADTRGMANLNLSKVPMSGEDTPSAATPTGVAFVLFTSGSTGIPKGIRLSQSGIMNYAACKSARLGLSRVKVLQQSSTGFDMSIAQAFNAFANGGTLVVASSRARGDPSQIAQLMAEEGIEFTLATPSEYMMLTAYASDSLRQCAAWKHACSGGEAVTDRLVGEMRRLDLPALTLTDCYGPTEISCATTFKTVPIRGNMEGIGQASASVGNAISNTSVYIVDRHNEILPIGFPGEICIGGCGVALGYLDCVLDSTRFMTNPFATEEEKSRGWETMYKTGDRGCLAQDGSLLFLGRAGNDSLLKLRGLRIDLDEIANAILLAAAGSLADVVVTVRGEPEFLVAHVVAAQGRSVSQDELARLRTDLPLPRYMVPAIMAPLDSMPMTANGKVDKKALEALPLPERDDGSCESNPLTVPEGELRLVWKDILGAAAGSATIKASTDFFTVGGSSLLLVRLQNALKERMGVKIPLQDLYQASTLGRMAGIMSRERSQVQIETIDWETETAVPEKMLKAATQAPLPSITKRGERHVVLTGSTGFLGSEILSALLRGKSVTKVHCIAVPPGHEHRLPRGPDVVVYPGSLASPTLGLSRRDFSFLKHNADQIIHAGAQGHCLNNYTSVKDANYLSTHCLATLALPRRVPLHLISSPRVILQAGSCASAPVSMMSHLPPADGSQGFTASKWASECFLERLSNATGLPVKIHRPCSVVGDRAPHDDAMNSVIRYSLLSKTVPAVPHAEGYFDFKDVVEVARDVVESPTASAGISFCHHSSGVRVPFDELSRRLGTLYGGEFKQVDMYDWLRGAAKLGIEELIVSYLEANVAKGEKLVFPYLGDTL